MKKFLSYSLVAIVCVGCFDTSPVAPVSNNMDLGVPSRVMSIVTTSGNIVTDTFTITLNVTSGAMYNVQLIDIAGKTVRSYGFTANAAQVVKTYDFSDVPRGAYDFTLMDTNGLQLKVPVLIKP